VLFHSRRFAQEAGVRRSHELIGNQPLSERDRLLIERFASALAAYYGKSRVFPKYRETALKMLRKRTAPLSDEPWRPDPQVESRIG
jgi:hypothetical protein